MARRALKGDPIGTIARLKKKLRTLPTSVAVDVAKRASPALTDKTTGAFAANRSVYGDARPLGVSGEPLTLERSGLVKRSLKFTADGRIVRCVIGPNYARFLIGKYGILPNGPIPADWRAKLAELLQATRVDLGGLK